MATITKLAIEKLEAGRILFDGGAGHVSGFHARRLPSRVVTFGLKYRDRGTGRQRWFRLGHFPTITPQQARDAARAVAGKVALGHDPQGEREAARDKAKHKAVAEARTVGWLADQFL